MNMISTGTFLTEMDASDKQKNLLVNKLVSAWEQKNSKTARAGGVSLMALSLAACGSSDSTSDAVSYTQAQLDAAKATATSAAATAALNDGTTQHASLSAAITSNDTTIANAALNDGTTQHASLAAAITSNDTAIANAVDKSTDDAAAISLALRDAAANLGVSGTSTMTDAELVTAIKTVNDTAIANAVDTTTDDAAAVTTAVTALGYSGITTLAQLNTAYDALLNPVAVTSTLTTAGEVITGSASADTVYASIDDNTAANDTLNVGDVINLAGGTDTLNVTAATSAAGLSFPAATISNVEIINLTNVSGQTLTLDSSPLSGVTTFGIVNSTAATTLTNITSGVGVNVTGNGTVTNGASAIGFVAAATSATVNITGGVTAGAITTTGTGLLTETYNSTGAANTTGTITAAATTTAINIAATTDLTAAITGTAIATLTVTGAGDVDTNSATLDTTIITVNASGSSGDVDVTLGAVAEATDPSTVDIADVTVTGGSGADEINMNAVLTARELSVDAGAGNDLVQVGSLLVTSGATIAGDVVNGGSGTDILSILSANANAQTAVTTVSGFEEITIRDASVTGGSTIANYQAGIDVLNLAVGGVGEYVMDAGSKTANLQAPLTGTLAMTDTGTATSDTLTIVNEDSAADAFADQAITSTGYETVNIVTTGAGTGNTALEQDVGVITVAVDTGGTSAVNFSGTNSVDSSGIITAHALNFSGLTAQATGTDTVNMAAAFEYLGATGSGTLTGSGGDDVLLGDTGESTNIDGGAGDDTITGGSAAETISGGAGDDTINGGGGADTINGNDGGDSITLGGATESVDAGTGDDTVVAAGNLTFGTTIAGGAGTDIISTNAAVSAGNGSVLSGFETLTLANAGTTDLDNFSNNAAFTNVNLFAGGVQAVQSVRSETITLAAALSGDATITLESATGSSDSASFILSSAGALDTTNDVLIAGVETINLTMTDTNTTAHQNTLDLGADSATTLNISGNAGVIFATGGGTDIADVLTMNASGITLGAVTNNGVTYAATYNTVGGVTALTGTNGVDSLTGGAATADTISGGSGVDTLVYTGGSDTFTGGAGNDIFDLNALGTSAVHLTIADAVAGDTIEIAGIDTGTATFNATKVALGSGATLAQYLDAAAAGNGGTNSIARYFDHGGSTYLANDNTAGATFAATDAVVQFTGIVDLSTATITSTVITIA